MQLIDALRELLANWRNDISQVWGQFLGVVEPDFAAVDAALQLGPSEVIFPGRKGRAPAGARPDSHIFRALEGIAPDEVRVVVIGQDPYTHVEQATGRSFEQGDLHDWLGTPKVSPSLRRIVQAVALSRTGDTTYTSNAAAWQRLVDGLKSGALSIPAARPLWDGWQGQGVVFINAILTFNRFEPAFQFGAHHPLWRPVVRRLLQGLAARQGTPTVFVAWGGKAESALADASIENAAKQAGTWGKTVTIVRGPHPNAPPTNQPPFLHDHNPLGEVNDALVNVGGAAIDW